VTDPGGNCLRIGQRTSREHHHRPAPEETFARALHHASLLADSKDDPAGAAKIIDSVLRREDEKPTPVQLLRLLVLRADVAGRLGDEAASTSAFAEAAAVRLTARERETVRDDLARLGELQGWVQDRPTVAISRTCPAGSRPPAAGR
jgi:hypothetical protein